MGRPMAAATMTPPPHATDFLARHGWSGARIAPLAGDASFRRYFRVHGAAGQTAVLMDAPPPHEDARPFLAIAGHLRSIGLSAPDALAAEPDTGLVLLEDFGDARLGPLLAAAPAREAALYDRAIDALVHLQDNPAPHGLRAYSSGEYRREADLFIEWWAPAAGLRIDTEGWAAAWDAALAPLLAQPHSVLALRDYHADNLMVLDDRTGVRALGLLDFQDALIGHPAYDLVSLLQDARRDVSPAVEARGLARFAKATGMDPEQLRHAYELLGAQRNLKIVGIFTRLWRRDGKPAYLGLLPRVWRHVERNLAHPATAPVARWMADNVPPAMRLPDLRAAA
jgi:aminoglycoside/choline kinase family phosphotransferase